MSLLHGKKGLIMGVANERSIAWGISKKLSEAGAELAFTYVGDALKKRVVPLAQSLGSKIILDCNVEDEKQIENTFSDIKNIIQKLSIHNYLGLLVENIGFETINYLKSRNKKNMLKKKMKTMIIHSDNDELIDVKYIKNLVQYTNELNIVGGTHSNINIDNDLIYKIIKFIVD